MLGCLAKVEVPLLKRVKIRPKIIDCVFIGYVVNSKAFRFLVHKSDNPEIHVNTIIESDNGEFLKTFICSKLKVSQQVKDLNDHEMNQ